MKIISVLNQKGGSGKTTLAVNIARALQKNEFSVLVVDSDTQASARDWLANNDNLTVIGLDRASLDKDIKTIRQDYDFVIIDGAPHIADISTAAIKISDMVLIPVQPSPLDIWASADLVEIIKARQGVTDGKPLAAFVVSRQISNTNLGNEIRDAIAAFELPVFKAGTSQRIAYPKAIAEASTVLDLEPGSDAAKEINLITNELLEFLK